ncbi:MAG TPA: hypothetical protein VFQ00_02400 [Terriglobales bacterium]|nr:hypothetical protein [Terriglobales bacterium]
MLSVASVFVLVSFLPGILHAQTQSKRLILKDGSYQVVTKWEVQGDRVHYYSAERYEWEDIPNSLVDWNATNQFNAQHPHANPNVSLSQIQQVDAEEEAERTKDEASRPEVAPGLRLPDSGGVFLFDHYGNQPQLVQIDQNGGELNKQMGKNIMRAVINPIPTGSKESIELKGQHAQVQAHDPQPVLYVDIVPDSSDTDAQSNQTAAQLNTTDRFELVRVQPKKDTRVVSNVKISLLGKVSDQESAIPTTSSPVSAGQWLKITPTAPLAPGEYALVEMLDPKTINMFVWDFGVNPSAPDNPTAWKPQQVKPKSTSEEQSPILGQRPK